MAMMGDSTDLDPSRCPDCGHYWPAHFRHEEGQLVATGCKPNAAALRAAVDFTPVMIRRGKCRPFLRCTIVTFSACRDPEAGTILVLDLAAETYHEVSTDYVRENTARLRGFDLERAKEQVELLLGHPVRLASH